MTLSLDTIPAENLPLKRNVAYQPVALLFTYPIVSIALAAFIILTATGWFIFGKRIKRYFQLRRLQRAHNAFASEFTAQVEQVKAAFSPQTAEAALTIWKKYMELLEARPYTKLTTREIQRMNPDEDLVSSLKIIDGAIYGYAQPETLSQSLQQLKGVADKHFEISLSKISNAR